mgnify:CR=1 FL=1
MPISAWSTSLHRLPTGRRSSCRSRLPRVALQPAGLASVRNRITVKFKGLTRSRLSYWTLSVDGVPATARAQAYPRGITVGTRRPTQGQDAPGNLGAQQWSVFVDNTRPRLVLRRVAQAKKIKKRRAVTLVVGAVDKVGVGKLTATATISTARGRRAGAHTKPRTDRAPRWSWPRRRRG